MVARPPDASSLMRPGLGSDRRGAGDRVHEFLRIDPGIAPANLVVGVAADRRDGWARSYLADRRLVQWRPPVAAPSSICGWAVDAEIAAQRVPVAIAERTGVGDPDVFWPRWTAIEVVAKLLDVPVVMWLAEHGLSARVAADHGVVLRTVPHAELVITVGCRLDHRRRMTGLKSGRLGGGVLTLRGTTGYS
jgi:hypothetical protein